MIRLKDILPIQDERCIVDVISNYLFCLISNKTSLSFDLSALSSAEIYNKMFADECDRYSFIVDNLKGNQHYVTLHHYYVSM